MSKIMFLGNFKFKQKSTGNDSYGYRFVEFFESKGEKIAKDNTLFSDTPIAVSGLVPGDIVDVKFSEPITLGGRRSLVGIVKKESSIFF